MRAEDRALSDASSQLLVGSPEHPDILASSLSDIFAPCTGK